MGQAGKTHDSLNAYDYAQQKSNKETHKVAEIAMNKYKYGFYRLQQEYLNHNQYSSAAVNTKLPVFKIVKEF